MKRIAAVLLAVAAGFGCETAVSSDVIDAPSPVKCLVTLAAPPTIDARGGSGSLHVTTEPECNWEASTNVSWISALSPPSGQGTAHVSFRVAANDDASTRDGMIVVNGVQVRVSQRAACSYDVAPSSQSIGVNGGAGTLRMSTSDDCSWTATPDAAWIGLTSAAEGNGNGTVSFTVERNRGDARTGVIVVASQRSTIIQAGVDSPSPPSPPPPSPSACTFAISPGRLRVEAAAGSGTVAVSTSSGCTWTASSNAAWIVVTSGASGSGSGTVEFRHTANTGNRDREGTLTIAGRTATIEQRASRGRDNDDDDDD